MRRAPLTEALPHGCRGARHGLLAVFTLCQCSLIALVRVMLVSLGGIGSSRGWTPVKIDRGVRNKPALTRRSRFSSCEVASGLDSTSDAVS